MAEERVGFIGLGTMGGQMAANLQRAGYHLVVHDVSRAAADPHLEAGAVWGESPAGVARAAQVVFTSLPGPAEVEAVALGENGLVNEMTAGMKAGGVLFDLSTNSPTVVRRIHGVFARRGVHLLDAPVSGGPHGAAAGTLAIWVSGEESVFSHYRPLLEVIGDRPRFVGPIGAATVAKLVHNCSHYALNRVLSEVFTLGVKAGVEPLELWEAIREGVAGRARTFDLLVNQFLPGIFEPPRFALRLAHKDVTLAIELARELEVPTPMADLALDELTQALERGWGDRDSRAAMLLQEERAGVEIRVEADRIHQALLRIEQSAD